MTSFSNLLSDSMCVTVQVLLGLSDADWTRGSCLLFKLFVWILFFFYSSVSDSQTELTFQNGTVCPFPWQKVQKNPVRRQ